MIDFVDSYMRDINRFEDNPADEQKILLKSISSVLPKILEYELTDKQRLCIKLFYVQGKSQTEIARQLKLSQPTVSRHISSAKAILNKFIGYCFYSVKKANEQWLSLE
ncbi:MAG: RNA polymerase sigma factor [Eubacterium sp.]